MTDFILALILITCSLAGVSINPKYDALIKRIAYTVLLVIGLIIAIVLFPGFHFTVVTI
jgi:hypothetical protein